MDTLLHLLDTDIPLPEQMNNPFDYEPHPLCVEAARRVCDYLSGQAEWQAEVSEGKMFGVLVCQDEQRKVGFLAAYSGQIGGRSDWPWFVPAVFDYLQPDGYFKQEEARITEMNHRMAMMEASSDMKSLKQAVEQAKTQGETEVAAYKTMMHEAKQRRDAERGQGRDDELVRESQFQKAELHRLKQRWKARVAEAETRLSPLLDEVNRLRQARKQHSDALQRWLFDQFVMLNAQGERRTLTDIFAPTPQRVPPAGAGECCAPKLLQYAFQHHLRPLAIAEFWQGRSPRMEIRHHGQYYTACRGKCKPILGWMLGENRPNATNEQPILHVLFADTSLVVIDKPAGLLSVPGKSDAPSAESNLRERYGNIYMVHRLDMDTSGLMVVARTADAHRQLQRQFLSVQQNGTSSHTIHKKYIALLDGIVCGEGNISLPMRPELMDRPRQMVDFIHGKSAHTHYQVLSHNDGHTLIALTPHTGRTHQLRVHCAHQEGLDCPIIGDRLYGKPAQRLCLHATELAFTHPVTGERLHFSSPAPF